MTDYTDLPEVNTLYADRETVSQAMAMLDNGGSLSSISVAPPPSAQPAIWVQVAMPPPTPPATVAQILNVLRDRLRDIDARLKELGVTDTPPVLATKPGSAARSA